MDGTRADEHIVASPRTKALQVEEAEYAIGRYQPLAMVD